MTATTGDIVIALITTLGVIIAAFLSYKASQRSKATLKNVSIDSGNGSLYGLVTRTSQAQLETQKDVAHMLSTVLELHETGQELLQWKRTYDDGPLDDGEKVQQFVGSTLQRLDRIEGQLTAHTEWEEEKKYGELEAAIGLLRKDLAALREES